jgi:hypothetical protein
MLDLSYFQNQNSNVQGFFNGGTWQTWIKPRGAKLVNIICVGAGSGGGGALQSSGTRGGGGGGASGAIARLTINANILPDVFYILPGIGGVGGITAAGGATAGSPGQNSFVTLIPSTGSVSNVLLRSGTTPSTGGGVGTTVAGTGGAAETINLITNNIFANLGNFTFQAGSVGSSGGTGAGTGITPPSFVNGGTGGGGTLSGGSFLVSGVFPAIAAAQANTNGAGNIILYKPTLMLFGGLGGGGSTIGGVGAGGNGAPGCGGGGAGANGNTGATPLGGGGRGGDGFVIITTSI